MLKRLTRRIFALAVATLLLLGWSAQAISFVTTGACLATMTASESSVSEQGQPVDSGPCKGITLKCMNSVGCTQVVGFLPTVPPVPDTSLPEAAQPSVVSDHAGLTIKPELAPPNLRWLT